MEVQIEDMQQQIPIDHGWVERMVKWTFHALGNPEGEVSIAFVDDSRMADLNQHYRKRQGSTDVLAFPMAEGKFGHITPGMWGDIVISVQCALEQSQERGNSLTEELGVLLIHGVLHLMGYDHEGVPREEAKRMRTLEAQLFNRAFGNAGIFRGEQAVAAQ